MSDEIALLPRLFKPLEKDQIRILVLYPSKDPNAPLVGHHELQTLAGKDGANQALGWKEYAALSYRWGDIAKRGSITLDTGQLGILLNTQLAISKIRHTKNNTRLWVDTICINQDDTREKSSQVWLMGRIYRQATSVVIWLDNDEQEFLFGRSVSARTGTSDYKVGEIELAKIRALERILLYDWVGSWWIAGIDLSVVSDLRILCGSVELSCNRIGDCCSVLGNSRMLQIKCGEANTRDLGETALGYIVFRESEQAHSSKDQGSHRVLFLHQTAAEFLNPQRNKDFNSHLWPQDNNTYGDLNFPRKTKGYATKPAAMETCAVDSIPSSITIPAVDSWIEYRKRKGPLELLFGNQESIAHEYGRSNANCKVLADASTDPLLCNNNVKTRGAATKRAETRSTKDCPKTDVTAIQRYMMFWTCVSPSQLCSTVDTRCLLSTHSNITS
jgi:hypothetical protein